MSKSSQGTSERLYQDEEWLEEKYVKEGLSMETIAELASCSVHTVHKYLHRYNITVRARGSGKIPSPDDRLESESWLRLRHVSDGLSIQEIAEMCSCSTTTVRRRLDDHGIELQPSNPSGRGHPNWKERTCHGWTNHGAERCYTTIDGDFESVIIHRLSAVAWFGWGAVIDKDIHHRIPVRWFNSESNIHPLCDEEHRIITGKYRTDGVPDSVVEDVVEGLECNSRPDE